MKGDTDLKENHSPKGNQHTPAKSDFSDQFRDDRKWEDDESNCLEDSSKASHFVNLLPYDGKGFENMIPKPLNLSPVACSELLLNLELGDVDFNFTQVGGFTVFDHDSLTGSSARGHITG